MRIATSALKQIYLDHNATSVMEQSAARALLFFSSDSQNFGNPSSVHWAGRKAKAAVEKAREEVASAFGVDDPEEICFTGSATEATNTALKGRFFLLQKERSQLHLITSVVEHEATLETAKFLEEFGARVSYVPVLPSGELHLEALKDLLERFKGENTLVSLMAANNETGVVFPWEEAARLAKVSGALFHLDAAQAPGKLPGFALRNGPVDFASFSAHKIGGPKGVGALYARKGQKLVNLLHGGAQERKRRAGTLNVAGIAVFGAAAATLAECDLQQVELLHDFLEEKVKQKISGVKIHGLQTKRLVNTSNFLFEGVRGEGLLMALDIEGIAVSAGSACHSGSILPSHVLLAMGLDKSAALSAIRVSLGPSNTSAEIETFVDVLARVIDRIRSAPKEFSKSLG